MTTRAESLEEPRPPDISSGLEFYWYEIEKEDEPGARWGQLAGGLHRLVDIRDDLGSVTRDRDIERCLHRLVIYVESFFARSYELRERAVALLAGMTGMREESGKLKSPAKRSSAESRLAQVEPRLAKSVAELVAALDQDTDLRNRHTHKQFLGLGLVTETGLYDPSDALLDLSRMPAARKRLVARLRQGAKGLAARYEQKITDLVRLTETVLRISDPAIQNRRGSPR